LQRLYRHDLEGFIWILPWVFVQFEGNRLAIPALEAWQTGDYAACAEAKITTISKFRRSENIATTSWKAEWQLAVTLVGWLQIEQWKRTLVLPSAPPPLSAQEIFDSFCRVLWVSRVHYPPLENIMHELKLVPTE